MDYAKAKCPRCGRSQWIAVRDAGLTIACPACGQRFAMSVAALLASPTPVVSPDVSQSEPPLFTPGLKRRLAIAGGSLLVMLLAGSVLWVRHMQPDAQPPPPAALPWANNPPAPPPPAPAPPTDVPTPTPPVASALVTQTDHTARAPAAATTAPTVRRAIFPVPPPAPPVSSDAVLDEQIGHAIDRGCDYLIHQFKDGLLPGAEAGNGQLAGADALAVYALLQAAKAVERPDLAVDTPLAAGMLDALRGLPMKQDHTTYDRALRACALAVYDRPADHRTLAADALWLQRSIRAGAYTYEAPPPLPSAPPGTSAAAVTAAALAAEENATWDNSNTQYGELGVWAAQDVGVAVADNYWTAVRKHWVRCQRPNGQWGYAGLTGADGELTMTVAGITMMFVAEDHLQAAADTAELGRPPYPPAVTHALAWLAEGDNAVNLSGSWPAYSLYGLERAGLASGIKSFGHHDWYRELAVRQLPLQAANGSWGDEIDTAFNLLFLSRGRHPILYDKLRFDGAWANRPRDVANLALFAGKELERPFNWQVVSADNDWQNWMDAPVLYLASNQPPALTDAQNDKLRAYAQNGGLIFTVADGAAPAFDHFVAELAARLFPRYPLRDLPANDAVFQSLFPLNKGTPPPRLQGVSNGSRLLLVHSPADLGRAWQLQQSRAQPVPFRVGMNVFIYAAGKANFHNELQTPYVPEPTFPPVATTSVARVTYDGDWNPEPAAAPRFARVFMGQTSIGVNVTDLDADGLDVTATPLALLTGTGPVRLSPPQLQALHAYVAAGGLLLVDACGGSPTFAHDVTANVLPHAFPERSPQDLPATHPILAGSAPGMLPIDARLRPFAAALTGSRRLPVQSVTVGKGLVLFCPADVTTGLLGTPTWGVNGYDPAVAYGLVRNALLFALENPPTPGPTTR